MPLADIHPHWQTVLLLGILLLVALVAGLVAQVLRLPRVTAYLLVGLMLGPHTHAVLPDVVRSWVPSIPLQYLDHLAPLGRLAMALVLFGIGCHFPLEHFRRVLRRVLRLSAGELGLTFLLVSLGMAVLPLGVSWPAALLFGAMAMATAPATTILVLKETESEGPVTEYCTALVALNNMAAVVVFEVIYRIIHFRQAGTDAHVMWEFGGLALDLAGSVFLGVAAGLITTYVCGLLAPSRWLVLLVAMTTLVLGLCGMWNVPYLLAFLAMGATVANASDRASAIVDELDGITGLLCVIFFVIHGAELDIEALLQAGGVGVAYAVLRSLGKYFGIYATSDPHHDGPQVQKWLGATLFAQAGAAIALSSIAANGLGEMGKQLQIVILGTVVYFEIIGPICIRHALLQSGEVPFAQAIRHTTTTLLDELGAMGNRLLTAVGIDLFAGRDPSELTVSRLMRKNVTVVSASASFDTVVQCLEESHINTLPVVGDERQLMGVIRYQNLQHVLFDPSLGALVCAEDLAVPVFQVAYADEPLTRAWQQFRSSSDDAMIVVTREEPLELLGVVLRRDLLRLFIKSGNSDTP